MRIGGGALGGRAVRVPKGVRPTGGRAREALFDIWSRRLDGSRFLDLFAGSGAVGIEAVSRGAARVVAVEQAPPVFAALRENYEALLPSTRWVLRKLRLPQDLSRGRLADLGPFDLVFADPPYAFAQWEPLLAAVGRLLAPAGEAAVEHGRRNRPPEAGGVLARRTLRSYGETELSFYSPPDAEPLSDARPR